MKSITKNCKGGAIFDWILVLTTIFTIVLVWSTLNSTVKGDLYGVANDALQRTDPGKKNYLDWAITVWNIFPVLSIIGLLAYGIVRTRGRDEMVGGGRLDL